MVTGLFGGRLNGPCALFPSGRSGGPHGGWIEGAAGNVHGAAGQGGYWGGSMTCVEDIWVCCFLLRNVLLCFCRLMRNIWSRIRRTAIPLGGFRFCGASRCTFCAVSSRRCDKTPSFWSSVRFHGLGLGILWRLACPAPQRQQKLLPLFAGICSLRGTGSTVPAIRDGEEARHCRPG